MITNIFNNFMEKDCKKIIDHISRLEGQLGAIKKELLKTQIDCSRASKIVLAASRSFATLRMNFVKTLLTQKYRFDEINKDEMNKLEDLLSIIKG